MSLRQRLGSLADADLLRRVEALEKRAAACQCWRMSAEVTIDRLEQEIDAVDDSLTRRIRSMEEQPVE